jgi:HEAT repeat protein
MALLRRRQNVSRLERRGDLDGLIAVLDRSDAAVGADGRRVDLAAIERARAAQALGRLGAEAAVSALTEALDDPVPGVRRAAVAALGAVPGSTALEPLCEAALRLEGDAREIALDALEERLAEASPTSARRAADAVLATPGDAAVAEQITELVRPRLDDPALAALTRRCLRRLAGEDEDVRGRATRMLVQLGPAVLEHLTPSLGDPALAAHVAPVFGELRDARATPALIELLTADATDLRVAAARALERIQDPRATYALLASTTDPEHAVRAAALGALDALGPMPTVVAVGQLVEKALADGGPALTGEARDVVSLLTENPARPPSLPEVAPEPAEPAPAPAPAQPPPPVTGRRRRRGRRR